MNSTAAQQAALTLRDYQEDQDLPTLQLSTADLMDLGKVLGLLTKEQRVTDRRLLLFGVRCARRLLYAAMSRVPISGITTTAIDTLERYAKGKATVDEAVSAGEAARTHRDSIPLQAISRILEQSIADIGVPVTFAAEADKCASAFSSWARHMHGMLAGAAMTQGADRFTCYQIIGSADGAERSYQHADLVDLFCEPVPTP